MSGVHCTGITQLLQAFHVFFVSVTIQCAYLSRYTNVEKRGLIYQECEDDMRAGMWVLTPVVLSFG